MAKNRFHACATCINFSIDKTGSNSRCFCKRLGFDTKTHYQFDCWDPKEMVRRLMEKESRKNRE